MLNALLAGEQDPLMLAQLARGRLRAKLPAVRQALEGRVTARLAAHGILIRHTPSPLANRVATGFYNTEAELAQLVESVRAIRDGLASTSA